MAPRKRTLAERFWPKVDQTEKCWLWIGAKNRHGYGLLTRSDGSNLAHRISWELHNGPIPESRFVCHTCDTPACVRPDHLFIGSAAANVHDMRTKGRNKGYRPDQPEWSGHIMARLPPELHAHLKAQAKEQGVSLNLLTVTLLSGASGFKLKREEE